MRLIDADEVTNKILYLLQGGVPSQDIRRGIKKIYTMLCDAPTIEAEPLKHGRWEKHDNLMGEYYHCSVCDTRTEVATCMGDPIFVYCPFCGAKMDKGVSA